MQTVVTITPEGDIRFLVNEDSAFLLEDNAVVRRASHVEPDSLSLRYIFHGLRFIFGEYGKVGNFTRVWPCAWRVNLTPTGGPILDDVWYNRQDAIDAEVVYLNEHFI